MILTQSTQCINGHIHKYRTVHTFSNKYKYNKNTVQGKYVWHHFSLGGSTSGWKTTNCLYGNRKKFSPSSLSDPPWPKAKDFYITRLFTFLHVHRTCHYFHSFLPTGSLILISIQTISNNILSMHLLYSYTHTYRYVSFRWLEDSIVKIIV